MDINDHTPGKLVAIAGSPKDLVPCSDAIRSVESLRISFSTTFYGQPQFSEVLLDLYAVLLQKNQIQPARVKMVDGGLDGIESYLEDMRHGRVQGGYKLVSSLVNPQRDDIFY
jgi:hypothetical protein